MYKQIEDNKRRTIILMVLFIAIIGLIGYAFRMMYPEWGNMPIIIAGIIAILMSLFGYYSGDKVALATSGAKGPIEKNDNPYVYRMVENLAITAGLPMPKVYIIEDSAMNAFATGRDPKHSSVALTRGIIEKLENEELEGVIAHELSHIKNYDIRIMTVVVVLVGLIAILSDVMIRMHWFGGGRKRSNDSSGGGQLGAILFVVGIILAILSPIIAEVIKLAVSRKREYLADASGALLTRYPEGLASALEKISAESQPLKKASKATAHLFISSPLKSNKKTTKGKKKMSLWSTHPPIEDRVEKLRGMA